LIFDIKKFSIHDGPGIRTTVFFKACPLSCQWCHNPESQAPELEMMVRPSRCIQCQACLSVCAQGAISWEYDLAFTDMERCTLCGACVEACHSEAREIVGREMTVAQVMTEIEKDIAFYEESGGGVTFSGGEPLQQRDFLLALLKGCKERGIHTAVDTSGFAAWETLDSVRQHVNLFLYDLKLMDDTRHQRFTGVSNELILRNLQMLSAHRHSILLRVPIIPGINDDDENIRQIGAFAATLPHLTPVSCRGQSTARLGLDSAQAASIRSHAPGRTATWGGARAYAGPSPPSRVYDPDARDAGRKLEPLQVGILPYHHAAVEKCDRLGKVYGLPEARPPSDERMANIARILQEFGLQVKVGG
jgi:pyruvate formate lyase activating enzyme